jgi:hypothetical protein
MNQDVENQLHTINMFVESVLSEMRKISLASTKVEMVAYIKAWEGELKTIKHIININGII